MDRGKFLIGWTGSVDYETDTFPKNGLSKAYFYLFVL